MRKNISMSAAVEERAQEIIKARGFDGLSDLLAALVREEYERRNPPVLHESSKEGEISSARKAELAAQFGEILSYSKKRKKKTASAPHPK